MTNIKTIVKGDILTIEIDLSKRFGKSSSGKTTIVATTAGNVKVDGHPDISIGINAYTK
jgi:ABC-type molybdate transport system ATPase subunit